MTKAVIGITMGDAAGIGAEIIVKALSDPAIYQICKPLVIGDLKILERARNILGSEVTFLSVNSPDEARFIPGVIDCLNLDLLPADLPFGKVSAAAGDAAYRFVERAVELAMSKQLDAICTAPLNKEALNEGGHPYPGHTEILAALTETPEFAMLFSSPTLKVILVTIHVGLLDAIRMITPQKVLQVIRLADDAMHRMGHSKPRIAVCGINPHAGEHGMFGCGEEEEKIKPAVERALNEGLQVIGPLAADTAFYRAVRGDFDIVVAMYHDQGLIAIKTLSLESAVNITVGLPIIRTSVDHGTAFDIAGKGIADERNLKEAIRAAAELCSQSDV